MADIKRKVPNLRFKGFTDDWEQRKLGEAAEIIGGGTPSTQISNYWNGDINWYTPAEISNFIYTRKSKRKISMEGLENSSARLLPVGTVLFTSRAGIGKTAILSKEGTTNQGFQSIVPNKKLLDSYFIFSLTNELKKYGETHGAGSTFIEISGRELAKAPLKLPALKEQKKIGGLLHQVDELIFLQQRKLDLLKQLKKGLLQKMFADKDSKQPVLRFNGFSGDWDEVKLSDNSKIFIGLVTSMTKHYAKNGTFLVRNSDISENFISHHKPIYLDSKFAEKNNNRRMRTNDVVTVHTGNIGTSAVISEKENGAIGFATIVTRPDRNVWNALFLSDYLNTSTHKKWAIRMATGDGRNNYNLRDFIRIRVPNPGIDEQKKVSKFVQLIENNISDQQQKIRNLETLKKSLLQQMFI